MLYALVIFVVLFLAAAVFAVVMFINNEDLRTDADNARTELEKYGTASELREVRPLLPKGGRAVTVLRQLTSDMRYLCSLIAGEDLQDFSLAGAKTMVDKRLNEEWWIGLSEVLSNPEEAQPEGLFGHIALASEDCNADFKRALAAGASPDIEPKDIVLAGTPVRIAFCQGFDGERIEFFQYC